MLDQLTFSDSRDGADWMTGARWARSSPAVTTLSTPEAPTRSAGT